ncbi:MAG: response regulator [Myxococcota bacterium]
MRLRRTSAAVAITLAVVSIFGWVTHGSWVAATVFGMRTNAAVGIVILGLACLVPARWARVLGVAGMVIGAVALLELAGAPIRLDEVFVRDWSMHASAPGRMSVFTAIALVSLGSALVFPPVATPLAAVVLLGAFMALVSRLYGVAFTNGRSVPFSTALALTMLAVAVLAGTPRGDPIGMVFGESIGGRMMRRLLPLVVAVPVVTGLLCRGAEWMGWMSVDQRLVAMTVVPVVLLVALTGFVAMRTDAYEEARREDEAHFRHMVDALPLGLWCAWPDGHVFHVNTRWRTYTGAGGSPAGSWLDAVHPDDRERGREAMAKALTTGTGVQLELRLVRTDGVARIHVARIAPIRGPEGDVRMWIGTFADVEDRRRAEVEAIQAQRMEIVGLLAGGIAHDFNNLLAGVNAHAGMARRKLGVGHPTLRHIDAILEASSRGAFLTRQLVGYAGKEAGVARRVALAAVVADLPDLVRHLLPAGARLRIEGGAPVDVVADESQLHQLLVNLVLNAAEALRGREGDISVRAFARQQGGPREAVVEVRDTGVGMDEATRARAFEPFFTTKLGGRGLGLAAVAGIVRSHGGTVSIGSGDEDGTGTVVTVALPAAPAEGGAGVAQPQAKAAGGCVLLVDDDPDVRKPLRETLELLGYSVIEAPDGPEAIERFERAPDAVDVVLLDLVMPKMGGEEVLRALRAIRPELPIVISSGFAQEEVARRLSSARVDGVLAKPWTVDQLSGVLARVRRPAAV